MAKVNIFRDIMEKNNKLALKNKMMMNGAFCVNLMSSPGAGKTSLLEQTLKLLGEKYDIAVIEGDVATSNDSRRLKKFIKPSYVYQIKTENYGGSCHLDANMTAVALKKLKTDKKKFDMIVIENVGNLICPADFNLGENIKAVMLSVTEGDDKPLKYPGMFQAADTIILSKTDLVKHVNFSIKKTIKNIRSLNKNANIIELSVFDIESVKKWTEFLAKNIIKSI